MLSNLLYSVEVVFYTWNSVFKGYFLVTDTFVVTILSKHIKMCFMLRLWLYCAPNSRAILQCIVHPHTLKGDRKYTKTNTVSKPNCSNITKIIMSFHVFLKGVIWSVLWLQQNRKWSFSHPWAEFLISGYYAWFPELKTPGFKTVQNHIFIV